MNRDFKGVWIPQEIWLLLSTDARLLEKFINHVYFNSKLSKKDFKKLHEIGLVELDSDQFFVSKKTLSLFEGGFYE